jgi:hypothetical protein
VDINSEFAIWLVVWIAAAAAVAYGQFKASSMGAGLVLAYVLNLWLIHWVATCLYLVPGYEYYNVDIVKSGFEQSTYGILAFAFGSIVLRPFLMNLRRQRSAQAVFYEVHEKLPVAYMIVGVVSYILLSSFVGRLPTANALIGVGQQLFVVGLCLSLWVAWWRQDMKKSIIWGGVVLLLPFITIVSRGFIGYGAMAVLTVITFIVSFTRVSVRTACAALLVVYIGLSFYVSYMRDRTEIRKVVWGGEPLESRVTRVYTTFSTLEWFDSRNEKHLSRVDERLNQNFLVGSAVDWLSITEDYARGETFVQAVLAFVPRAIWPEKPVFAGSGDLASQYTGMLFDDDTSVGIGQVMEFYVNFGTAGVIVGFMIMGIIISFIDIKAGQRLWHDDWQSFALWYLPGISFLQVGGSLVEVTSSAGASVVAVLLVNKALLYRFERKQVVESGETQEANAY